MRLAPPIDVRFDPPSPEMENFTRVLNSWATDVNARIAAALALGATTEEAPSPVRFVRGGTELDVGPAEIVVWRITSSSASLTVTLPFPEAATGSVVYILKHTNFATATVTVEDPDGAVEAAGTMGTSDRGGLYVCDGDRWVRLGEG